MNYLRWNPACPLTTKAGAKRRFNLATDSCQTASAGPFTAAKSIRLCRFEVNKFSAFHRRGLSSTSSCFSIFINCLRQHRIALQLSDFCFERSLDPPEQIRQNAECEQSAGERKVSFRLVALGPAAASAPWLIPVNLFVGVKGKGHR